RPASRTSSRSPTASRTPAPSFTATATLAPPTATLAPSGRDVGGSVQYYSNALPVPKIAVHASSAAGGTSSSTDTSGHYLLADVATESVLVSADAVGGTGNAISALDAAYILQFVAGLRQLSAQQALACDVTGNGHLTPLDAP